MFGSTAFCGFDLSSHSMLSWGLRDGGRGRRANPLTREILTNCSRSGWSHPRRDRRSPLLLPTEGRESKRRRRGRGRQHRKRYFCAPEVLERCGQSGELTLCTMGVEAIRVPQRRHNIISNQMYPVSTYDASSVSVSRPPPAVAE